MARTITFLLLTLLLCSWQPKPFLLPADIIADVEAAFKNGDSKSLSKHFDKMIELSIKDKSSNYSKAQAEAVLQDFFKSFPVKAFRYFHDGSGKEGLKYRLGVYEFNHGQFNIFIIFRQNPHSLYTISSINISDE